MAKRNWIKKVVKKKGVLKRQLHRKKLSLKLVSHKISQLKKKKKRTKAELREYRRLVLARTLMRLAKKRHKRRKRK